MICADDRRIIGVWAEHGIPTNSSSLAHAAKLLVALLADVDRLTVTLGNAMESWPASPDAKLIELAKQSWTREPGWQS